MGTPESFDLNRVVEAPEDMTPLLQRAWNCMPHGIRRVVSEAPVIPSIAARARAVAPQSPDFVRSDQGQIVGVCPEREIYYGPTAGFDELRELVARFWTHAYHLKDRLRLDKRNVAIVSGATQGLALVLKMFSSGRNVGITRLHWDNYENLIRSAGGTPVVLDLFSANHDLDLKSVERAIKEEDITSLLVNFPTNPSGDVLTPNELKNLVELARRLDLILISDEVYNYLRYKGTPQSMLELAPERAVVISSASKEYLIPGARVGYVIAANKTLTNVWLPRLIRASSSSPNVLGQRLLLDILKDEVEDLESGRLPRTIAKIREELGRRRDLLIAVLTEKGFTLAGRDRDYPAGAISLLARLPDYVKDDDLLFVEKAIAMRKFSAIPGSVFGAPRCLRFGYAGMTEDAIRRLGRNLEDVLDSYKPQHK